jgi:hypothetical protein
MFCNTDSSSITAFVKIYKKVLGWPKPNLKVGDSSETFSCRTPHIERKNMNLLGSTSSIVYDFIEFAKPCLLVF